MLLTHIAFVYNDDYLCMRRSIPQTAPLLHVVFGQSQNPSSDCTHQLSVGNFCLLSYILYIGNKHTQKKKLKKKEKKRKKNIKAQRVSEAANELTPGWPLTPRLNFTMVKGSFDHLVVVKHSCAKWRKVDLSMTLEPTNVSQCQWSFWPNLTYKSTNLLRMINYSILAY